MGEEDSHLSKSTARGEWFRPTSWTLIQAARDASPPERRAALEELCSIYWYPLYAYVRRHGRSPEDAEDLTQSFFHRLLEHNFLGAVDRRKGKFRSFLLASLKYFLVNEHQFRTAAKRGGGRTILSLDQCLEERFTDEPATPETPERQFDRDWASALVERARRRLHEEYDRGGKSRQLAALERFLVEESSMADYDQLGPALGISANAVAIAVHRLRHRYRDLLREEISRTVSSPEDAAREMDYLLEIMGNLP